MNTKRLTRIALLTCMALGIHAAEAALPPIAPIPGIKPGLANIITTWAVFMLCPQDAGIILMCRIMLGTLVTGSVSSLPYAAAGGTFYYLITLLLKHLLTQRQLWISGILGAAAHNAGQVAAAMLITQTVQLAAYFPMLMLSGMVTGLFTGLCIQFVVNRTGIICRT